MAASGGNYTGKAFARRSLDIAKAASASFKRNGSVEKRRIKTSCGTLSYIRSREAKATVGCETEKGIVPNLVHSLDAAHLMRTIQRLRSQKFRDFAVIHDGYAMHACDVDALHETLRAEFVAIYSKPVLPGVFLRAMDIRRGRFAVPAPASGNFKIDQVLNSLYFFPEKQPRATSCGCRANGTRCTVTWFIKLPYLTEEASPAPLHAWVRSPRAEELNQKCHGEYLDAKIVQETAAGFGCTTRAC